MGQWYRQMDDDTVLYHSAGETNLTRQRLIGDTRAGRTPNEIYIDYKSRTVVDSYARSSVIMALNFRANKKSVLFMRKRPPEYNFNLDSNRKSLAWRSKHWALSYYLVTHRPHPPLYFATNENFILLCLPFMCRVKERLFFASLSRMWRQIIPYFFEEKKMSTHLVGVFSSKAACARSKHASCPRQKCSMLTWSVLLPPEPETTRQVTERWSCVQQAACLLPTCRAHGPPLTNWPGKLHRESGFGRGRKDMSFSHMFPMAGMGYWHWRPKSSNDMRQRFIHEFLPSVNKKVPAHRHATIQERLQFTKIAV